METKKRNRYLLFLGYGIMTVLAYAVQFTPLLPRIFGAYPAPLLLLVIIVAMHENDWCGMLYGMLCGMLTDLNALTPPGTSKTCRQLALCKAANSSSKNSLSRAFASTQL